MFAHRGVEEGVERHQPPSVDEESVGWATVILRCEGSDGLADGSRSRFSRRLLHGGHRDGGGRATKNAPDGRSEAWAFDLDG
jgi:hypothetical protein